MHLAEEVVHEGADNKPQLCPKGFIVWLENRPLRPAVQTFFDKERGAPHMDILPLRRENICAVEGTGSPDNRTDNREETQADLPPQISPRCVNAFQTDLRGRVHPPGFWDPVGVLFSKIVA